MHGLNKEHSPHYDDCLTANDPSVKISSCRCLLVPVSLAASWPRLVPCDLRPRTAVSTRSAHDSASLILYNERVINLFLLCGEITNAASLRSFRLPTR